MQTGSVCIACRSRDCLHVTKPAVQWLTAREVSIVVGIASGEPNKLIAHRLRITEGTLKTYNSRIFEKFGFSGAGSRMQTAFWARDNAELLTPPKAA